MKQDTSHGPLPLRSSRVHEVYGPAATTFAAVVAAMAEGQVLWIRNAWSQETLYPAGLSRFIDPSKLLLARTQKELDSLAIAEQALRSGTLSLVLVETQQPIEFREGRRLQLAAQEGGTTGLCLIPEGMGSNAVESRWHAAPMFDDAEEDSTLMHLDIIKNKTGTFGAWDVKWCPEARRLHVVSPTAQRPHFKSASG